MPGHDDWDRKSVQNNGCWVLFRGMTVTNWGGSVSSWVQGNIDLSSCGASNFVRPHLLRQRLRRRRRRRTRCQSQGGNGGLRCVTSRDGSGRSSRERHQESLSLATWSHGLLRMVCRKGSDDLEQFRFTIAFLSSMQTHQRQCLPWDQDFEGLGA